MIKEQALHYLGYQSQEIDDELHRIIDEAIKEVSQIANFRIVYGEFDYDSLDLTHEAYKRFLGDEKRIILMAATLGNDIDKFINRLMKTDMRKAIVCDAVSNAIIEQKSDEAQSSWGYNYLSYRFAPGYQGTDVSLIHIISKMLDANKIIGISILDTNIIVPKKSLVGILIDGAVKRKNCKGCVMIDHCDYLRRRVTCY